MKPTFEERLKRIDWSNFDHPCKNDQSIIPALLKRIHDKDKAREAALELWNVAAHQGCVGPSSAPTAVFLLEMIEQLETNVQVEVLDTLYQFSNCIGDSGWEGKLKKIFSDAVPIFTRLKESHDEDVADFSEMILENVNQEIR